MRAMAVVSLLLAVVAGTTVVVQLKSADTLHKIGLPTEVAKTLAAQLAEAEKRVAPERLAQFSKFEGIVMMDQHGPGHGHPPHHK